MVIKVEKSPASAENRSSTDVLWKDVLMFKDWQLKFTSWIYHTLTCFLSLTTNSFFSATSIFNLRLPQGLISLNMTKENASGRGVSDPEKQKPCYQVTLFLNNAVNWFELNQKHYETGTIGQIITI